MVRRETSAACGMGVGVCDANGDGTQNTRKRDVVGWEMRKVEMISRDASQSTKFVQSEGSKL